MVFKALWVLDTYWFMTHREKKDPLEDPEWVKWYAQKLTGLELTEGADALCEQLTVLRPLLDQLVKDLQVGIFSEVDAINLLNPYLQQSSGRRFIRSEGDLPPTLHFEPEKVDDSYVLSELAAKWFELLFENDRSRIRICENPDCACYYYDESKNKSKRHCASNCSNVMKVRRHREKKAQTEFTP